MWPGRLHLVSFLLLVLSSKPTPTWAEGPTPAPTIVRDPDHEFDFRGCTSTTTCGSLTQSSWCNSGTFIVLGTPTSASACLALCESYDLTGTSFSSGCCQWCSGTGGCDGSSGVGYGYNECSLMEGASDTTWGDASKYYSTDDCTAAASNGVVADAYDSSITATASNGATCSSDGMVFDGIDDYVDVTSWLFGGEAMTVEAYVKYDALNSWSRILDFADGANDDNVFFGNRDTTGTATLATAWPTTDTARRYIDSSSSSFFETGTWVHVVVTVEGTTMSIYKGGTLENTITDGQEPASVTRSYHWIGKSTWSSNGYFDGTIAYLRFWHGQALNASQVAQLYAARIEPTPAPTGQ